MLNPLACALESPQISQPLLELQKWWAIATKNQDAHLWGVVLAHVDNFPDYLYGVKAELKLLKSIAQAHRAAAIERGFTEQLLEQRREATDYERLIHGFAITCNPREHQRIQTVLEPVPDYLKTSLAKVLAHLYAQDDHTDVRVCLETLESILRDLGLSSEVYQLLDAFAKVVWFAGFKFAHARLRQKAREARLPRGVLSLEYPPYCNTGGYGFAEKISNSVTAIDWLRATITDFEAFEKSLSEIVGNGGVLDNADIDVQWSTKGLHGYETSASLLIWKDNDFLTVGHIGMSREGRNQGGMFELTGVGCKVLQIEYPELWLELYQVLTYYGWRLSRVDIALDLMGDYAKQHHYTVPRLFKLAVNGQLFRSDNLRNPNMKQSFTTAGDWSPLVVGNVTPENYDPLEHCPAGLTAYIGNRGGSEDFFRIYEKGKEVLGSVAEPDNIDRSWVRIEHEMTRKSKERVIPLEVMTAPDEYFCAGRSGVRFLMLKLRTDKALEAIQQWKRDKFKREKSLLLSRKIHWAKHAYGRLIKTLQDKGYTASQIIEVLSRTAGLKDFVYDLGIEEEAKIPWQEVGIKPSTSLREISESDLLGRVAA